MTTKSDLKCPNRASLCSSEIYFGMYFQKRNILGISCQKMLEFFDITIVYFWSSFLESQKNFRPHFKKSRLECFSCVSFTFRVSILDVWGPILYLSYSFWQLDRSRRTRKGDQKCPEKQAKKSKSDIKNIYVYMFITMVT